jgi:hypothetical protein
MSTPMFTRGPGRRSVGSSLRCVFPAISSVSRDGETRTRSPPHLTVRPRRHVAPTNAGRWLVDEVHTTWVTRTVAVWRSSRRGPLLRAWRTAATVPASQRRLLVLADAPGGFIVGSASRPPRIAAWSASVARSGTAASADTSATTAINDIRSSAEVHRPSSGSPRNFRRAPRRQESLAHDPDTAFRGYDARPMRRST